MFLRELKDENKNFQLTEILHFEVVTKFSHVRRKSDDVDAVAKTHRAQNVEYETRVSVQNGSTQGELKSRNFLLLLPHFRFELEGTMSEVSAA